MLFSSYDIIFGTIILISAILAMLKGGVAELLALSKWIIALLVMRKYAANLEKIIPEVVSNHLLRSLISYIIAFVAVAVIIAIISNVFHKFIKHSGLGGLDFALGGLFGIIRGFIICAIAIIVIEMFNLDAAHSWHNSLLSPILIPSVSIIVNAIPEQVKQLNHEAAAAAKIKP